MDTLKLLEMLAEAIDAGTYGEDEIAARAQCAVADRIRGLADFIRRHEEPDFKHWPYDSPCLICGFKVGDGREER